MQQPTMEYPASLTEKYRPERVKDFIGLSKPKAIMLNFIKRPYSSAWLFLGEPGIGKTAMAQALVNEIKGELHHIPSRTCDLETVEETVRMCHYVPFGGGYHVVLVDEADQMTQAAQISMLSKLDSTAFPPSTIFIFTANSTKYLEKRFLSRCRVIEFSTFKIGKELPSLLRRVWKMETGKNNGIDFDSIIERAERNVRDAYMHLELEILGHGVPDEPKDPPADLPSQPKTIYHERAAKAVATREKNIREKVVSDLRKEAGSKKKRKSATGKTHTRTKSRGYSVPGVRPKDRRGRGASARG